MHNHKNMKNISIFLMIASVCFLMMAELSIFTAANDEKKKNKAIETSTGSKETNTYISDQITEDITDSIKNAEATVQTTIKPAQIETSVETDVGVVNQTFDVNQFVDSTPDATMLNNTVIPYTSKATIKPTPVSTVDPATTTPTPKPTATTTPKPTATPTPTVTPTPTAALTPTTVPGPNWLDFSKISKTEPTAIPLEEK